MFFGEIIVTQTGSDPFIYRSNYETAVMQNIKLVKLWLVLISLLILCIACNSEKTADAKTKALTTVTMEAAQTTHNRVVNMTYRYIDGRISVFVDTKPPLYHVALEDIRKRATDHNPAALYELSRRLSSATEDPPQDIDKSLALLQQAADLKDPDAQNALGMLYTYGEMGLPKNESTANEWFLKAAEQGNMEAQFNLAASYKYGSGTNVDMEKALFWYRKAAEQNHPMALNTLGSCYRNGEGVQKDTKKAFDFYKKASDLGAGMADFNIGNMYDFGDGVATDKKKAFEYYRKGAERGYPKAKTYLGAIYEDGIVVPQNYQKAVEWYRKGAEDGDPTGQFNLGLQYYNGTGVKKNYGEALKWFRAAAKNNFPQAVGTLATMYMQGQGVSADYQKGYEYAQKGAKLGHAISFYNLGQYYQHGIIVNQSNVDAYAYYMIDQYLENQKGEKDPELAKDILDIKNSMTPAQISQAEAKVPELMREYGLD